MRCGLGPCVSIVAILASLAAPFGQARADALSDLDIAFREAYRLAATRTLSDLRASVPVLVNRFGQIALYRPGVDQPDVFSMNMTLFLEVRDVAHTAAALDARLSPFGLETLDAETLAWLDKFASLLSAAEIELKMRDDIPEQLKTIQSGMLEEVKRSAQQICRQGTVDQVALDQVGSIVRAAVRRNLAFAAASQLEQFRTQVDRWKAAYPTLAWDRAVVVVIGMHQSRDDNLQRQFFDWLLHDRPERQDRVVLAETIKPPPPLDKEPASEALSLLSEVMLDKSLSNFMFGDPSALQSDVLGAAAESIIEQWPKP